jgi:hypothetical protein
MIVRFETSVKQRFDLCQETCTVQCWIRNSPFNVGPIAFKDLWSISFANHIAIAMPFPFDASLRPEPSTKRWQPDGLEGQQLKNDVFSIFHDGSLDVDNPNY